MLITLFFIACFLYTFFNTDKGDTMAEFKVIEGYEKYSVSKSGIVINNQSGKILNQRLANNGYLRVNLRKGNVKYEKPHVKPVHRLVAESWIPNPHNYNCVNHIDGVKTNNNINNLEWCTFSHNSKHGFDTGLQKQKKGVNHKQSKAVCQYKDGVLVAEYGSAREAERETGIGNSEINKMCNGKKYPKSTKGFTWKFKE